MAKNDDIQDIARALDIFSTGRTDTAASILLDVRDRTTSRHVRNLVYRTIEVLKLDQEVKRILIERKAMAVQS